MNSKIFCCILNVVLTFNVQRMIDKAESEISSHVEAEIKDLALQQDSSDENIIQCFEDFNSSKTNLFSSNKYEIIYCMDTAKEQKVRAGASLFSSNLAQRQRIESSKSNNEVNGYLEETNHLHEIIQKIKSKENNCVCRNIEGAKLKGTSIALDLKKCLQYAFDLANLKEAYTNLEICVGGPSSKFNNCIKEAENTLKDRKDRLREVSAKYSEEINTLDQKENTCFRHFITEIVFPDFAYAFGLENCLKQNFTEPAIENNKQVNLINGFRNLQNALRACRADKDKENIRKCISETFSNSEEFRFIEWSVQRIPDEMLHGPNNKVYKVFSNETDCVGQILEKIKFRGLFMSDSTREDYAKCMEKRYISNTEEEPPTSSDCVNKLKTIETSLIKCTYYPVGPEFSKCVAEIIESSRSSLAYVEKHQFLKLNDNQLGMKFGSAYQGSFFKCLGEILAGYGEQSCSSNNTNSNCSYRNIERCIIWTFPSRLNKKATIHQDEYTQVYLNKNLGEIKENVSFTITGYILPDCENFFVNLVTDYPNPEPHVALHVNPRLPENQIFVNAWVDKYWKRQESYSTLPFFGLHRGSKFTIQILITDSYYKIAVNGKHLANYNHCVPYKSVSWIEVKGGVEVISLERSESSIYPKPFPETEASSSELTLSIVQLL